MAYFKKNLLTAAVTFAISSNVYASTETNKNGEERLAEIVVYANQNSGLSSIQTISQDEMKKTPSENGNISDYLKANPHVRYEHSDPDGFTRGEIKPENISINGAEENQTAYFVDNVNVNNDLGTSDLFSGDMATLPQANHGQGYFFDGKMLSSVTVQDSNISASLGGFAGGAVVAKTKQYNGKDGVSLNYRTTRSSWAKINVDPDKKEQFEQARPNGIHAESQPVYSKHFFNIMAEKGLSDNLGMVMGFSRRGSHIQQTRQVSPTGETDHRDNTRRSDNALMNFTWTPDEKNRIEWGVRYSNYRESKFYANNIDSDVLDYHQAYGSTLAWVRDLDKGVLTTTLAYDKFTDKRHSASTHLKSYIVDGEEYTLGGMGNSQLTQDNVHFSTEYAINPFDIGAVNHSISLGGIYQYTKYRFHRDQDALGEVFLDGVDEPISQNFARKGTVRAKYQNIALYTEDLMKWRNWAFRPGLRVERDDYLKNTNIAPRFVTTYSPWEDTQFSLGLNRYYGRSFASMKLAEGIFQLDGHDTFRYQQIRDFKTPYADELSLGATQNWHNLAVKLNYIHRNNKNRIELAKDEDGNKYYRQGKNYGVDVYTLQLNNIEPWQWGATQWNAYAAFDWLNTKRVNLDDNDPAELVFLDGKQMTRSAMRQKVNNQAENWMVRLGVDMQLPKFDITWSNRIIVKAPIKGYRDLSDLDDTLDANTFYQTYHYGTHTQWNTSLRWQPKLMADHSVYVKFDVLNVLNKTRKHLDRETYGSYTPGREFWLEVGYEF